MKSAIRKLNATIIPGLAVTALALGIFASPVISNAQETATLGAKSSYCCLKRKKVGRGRWTKKCKLIRVATRTHNRANSNYWIVITSERKLVCNWVRE